MNNVQPTATIPNLDQNPESDLLSSYAINWAACNGLQVGRGDSPPRFTHVPLSLLPQALPSYAFEKARLVAPIFGTLVHRVSQDSAWLQKHLQEVCETDDFTKRLVEIQKAVDEEGDLQPLRLGILRSDYMLHDPAEIGKEGLPTFLQVELNTIASSFGCLSAQVAKLHQHLIGRFSESVEGDSGAAHFVEGHITEITNVNTRKRKSVDGHMNWQDCQPENPTLSKLPSALAAAHAKYQPHQSSQKPIIVFVVQDGETNVMDQRLLEFRLWETHSIPVQRMSLGEINRRGSLVGEHRCLMIDGVAEVAVVYFRAGYTPNDYLSEAEWQARLLIERSYAIKCPNIGYHLAGTKKVQQVLTKNEELSRFLSADECAAVSSTFAKLFSFGSDAGEETRAAVEDCLQNSELYVLKPQREGGGNNLYGEELVAKLQTDNAAELQEYVLMERFFPKAQKGLLLREGELLSGMVISELGIYSTFLGNKDEVCVNEYAGYLLRTKFKDVNEGGVAAGFAVLSSPILVSLEPKDAK